MNSVYLDCSGLHNIRVDGSDVPRSIYIDGTDFLNRLSTIIEMIPTGEQKIIVDEKTVMVDEIKLIVELTKARVDILKLKADQYNWQCFVPEETQTALEKTLIEINTQLQKFNK